MAQKTNFNVNPYFDDFDRDKNFYRVLFNPGRPVQSRELNTIQSILQNQIESFGSHIFKEGSMVIPGGISYDQEYFAIKLNPLSFGVDISLYIEKYVGKIIRGEVSGISASVKQVVFPDDQDVEYITLYVKYLDSDSTFSQSRFIDGESLLSTEAITYGINNIIISDGVAFASLISEDATSVGSSVSIENGIYFVRGVFANVEKETLILDYYTNTPSYRVGLRAYEQIITSKDDSSLYDNAKGFTNFASPGADRFKIELKLTKKLLTDNDNDTDFIELLRVENGSLKKIQNDTDYNLIKDYIAKRTYDESGNYTVVPFKVTVNNSLNNLLGNNGLFVREETTSQGNNPSDDVMCLTISPGKAYVKGYDIEKTYTTVIDVDKPRETTEIDNVLVPFKMGNILRVNNVYGAPINRSVVSFYNERRNGTTSPTGTKIGESRVYLFRLTDSAYVNASTSWDLYFYDPQFYTKITINNALSSLEFPLSSVVVGKSSGAIGYAVNAGSTNNEILIRQVSGKFLKNESIKINGTEALSRSIVDVLQYTSSDVKSVYQSNTPFLADVILQKFSPSGFSNLDEVTIKSDGTVVSPKPVSGINIGDIVRYVRPGFSTETYNVVTDVSLTGSQFTLSNTTNVSGVSDGSLPSSDIKTKLIIGSSSIVNQNSSYLYSILPNTNIESVDLSGSQLTFSAQAIINDNIANNVLVLSTSDFALPQNYGSVKFDTFDVEKYSIHYSDGTIEPLRVDQISFNLDYTQITFSGIQNKTLSLVNGTFVKLGIQSKTKLYKKSSIVNVNLSKYQESGSNSSSSLNDGLTYNQYYGLRVQDEEICLRYPDVTKVIAVYESIDELSPSFDSVSFSSLYDVDSNSTIGENITGKSSKAVARIVGKSGNTLEFVYLNNNKFQIGEDILFEYSDLSVPLQAISFGRYKNITNAFKLNKGQKNQFYDYSRLIRNPGQSEPSKRLSIVFDHFDVSANDIGDIFTVLSYPLDSYSKDIPNIGFLNTRASDTLDFRPRVSYFGGSDSSPFDFSSRNFDDSIKVILTPNESCLLKYNVYQGRIDKLFLDSYGGFIVEKGVSSLTPKEPVLGSDYLEIATISLPPYLYDPSDAKIKLTENKRYTMRDIGTIENRVENLERVTSLSLLELQTQTLQIQDSDGIDRFKTGFFADSFKNDSFINLDLSLVELDDENQELVPLISRNTLKNQLISLDNINEETADLSVDYLLTDVRVKKTGAVVTLDYTNEPWIEQPLATRVENVNPFHVIQYVGDIRLNPFRDVWIRTIQLSDRVITHNNTLNLQSQVTTERLTLNNVDNTSGSGSEGLGGIGQVRDTWTELSLSDAVPSGSEVFTSSDSSTSQSTERSFIESSLDIFIRSRNTEFITSNLKAHTRYYPFLDGVSTIDVIPKLIEVTSDLALSNPGTDGSFTTGENVLAFDGGVQIMTFRLASPDHKFGPYNNPTTTFTTNPYSKDDIIPSEYSSSSTTLNIDTFSLAEEAQGNYFGYLTTRTVLIGETSGAVAYVKDIRLVTDNFGDLIGSFFIRDPNTLPPPTTRFPTGNKTFRLSSSSDNENGLVNNTDISSAEANYLAEGTVQTYQNIVRVHTVSASLTTTNNIRTRTLNAIRNEEISTLNLPPPVVNNITNVTNNVTRNVTRNVTNVTRVTRNITNVTRNIIRQQAQHRVDPLAQTFLVGSARGLNAFNDDENGCFITALDLFFAKKDPGNAPITIQIRTVELGLPTLTVLGDSITLRPDQINVSSDASVATNIVLPYPIFLPPAQEYAIVALSPQSDQYELWTARMGEKTVNTTNLPDAESVRYTRQFAIGSLFKSQNGSTWTPDQYEDLKFKLYKAKFNTTEGIAYFQNPTLSKSNSYIRNLSPNPIVTIPRKVKVGIVTIYDSNTVDNILTIGRKISESGKEYIYGNIVGTGSSVSNVTISDSGFNYPVGISTVETFNVTGNGSGLKLEITADSDGNISVVTINAPGSGYAVGDVVGIVTSTVTGNTNTAKGQNARITISSNGNSVDTVYLSNVQGDNFTTQSSKLVYYNNAGSRVEIGIATISSSTNYGEFFNDGKHFKVNHFNHGMYGLNNIVELSGVLPDTVPVRLSSDLLRTDSSLNINSSDVSKFELFEGIPVSVSNPGYIIVNNEIIQYTSFTNAGTLGGLSRSIDNTISIDHPQDSLIYKYEISGVSLRRINKNHNIVTNSIDLDSYYLEIDRDGLDENNDNIGENRSIDDGTYPMLSFNSEKGVGGNLIYASENIPYDTIFPYYEVIIPGASTNVQGLLRTVSGTSCNGIEESFNDLGYQPIEINSPNKLNSLRLVSSKVNSDEYLTFMPRNKSMVTALTLTTNNYNLSPLIFLDTTFTEYRTARLNKPITNFANDGRINTLFDDPHAAIYVSKTIRLTQPSNTLKVFLSAYRHSSADFRVLYSLLKPESVNSEQSFTLFPGYNNLTTDNNLDGYLDVIDETQNNGLPDIFVQDSLDNQFLEYQYTAADVGPFIGFTIKIVMSGTRQDKYPRFKDIRAIAIA